MKFTMFDFTEHWASIYKPIRHDMSPNAQPARKRFFFIDNFNKLMNLAKELPTLGGPFVAMESNMAGDIDERFLVPEYSVYFFVQAKPKAQGNDVQDMLAKQEAMHHAVAYVNYIRTQQRLHENDMDSPLMGVDLESVHFETFGPSYNRWYCVGIAFNECMRFSNCVNNEDYLTDDEDYNATV
jgi:hypothetical protein